jgi:hypothetical protein
MHAMKTIASLALFIPFLVACDAVQERMGLPIAAKVEAEGKAIGSACRHAGRGLEDCFRLNAKADKAAVHTGWKEMNEYMLKNNMQAITPEFPASLPTKAAAHANDEKPDAEDDSHGDKDKVATPDDKDGHDKHGKDAAAKSADEDAKDAKAKTENKPADKSIASEKAGH